MKIISKYKDYYDYLQGVYGVDEKKVLDRTSWDTKQIINADGGLIFCNTMYLFLTKDYIIENFFFK